MEAASKSIIFGKLCQLPLSNNTRDMIWVENLGFPRHLLLQAYVLG